MQPFADHFSRAARQYAAYRPTYPPALFAWLAEHAPSRASAWDCATGSGQAARGLAPHFDRVIATDASAEQIGQAETMAGLHYAVMRAEECAIRDGSMGLVTVAQALHWFSRPLFYAEVRRVLAPGGLLAVWRYGLATIDPVADAILQRFHGETLAPYWPAERAIVDAGYHTIGFPFRELTAPAFTMEARWTLAELAGYLATWSAVGRYRAAVGEDPLPAVVSGLARAWGPPGAARTVRWPLEVRAGVV